MIYLIFTGNEIVDQILIVLLSTSMLVGGLIGFLLDNTIPGKVFSNVASGTVVGKGSLLHDEGCTYQPAYGLLGIGVNPG